MYRGKPNYKTDYKRQFNYLLDTISTLSSRRDINIELFDAYQVSKGSYFRKLVSEEIGERNVGAFIQVISENCKGLSSMYDVPLDEYINETFIHFMENYLDKYKPRISSIQTFIKKVFLKGPIRDVNRSVLFPLKIDKNLYSDFCKIKRYCDFEGTPEEISQETGISLGGVRRALNIPRKADLTDKVKIKSKHKGKIRRTHSRGVVDPSLKLLVKQRSTEILKKIINDGVLSPKQRLVISKKYDLEDPFASVRKDTTIASYLNITREGVRRNKVKAFKKLKRDKYVRNVAIELGIIKS